MDEIKIWSKSYRTRMPAAPNLLFAKAQKTFFQGRFYIRVPLEGSTGMIYFAKSQSLEAMFIRIVADNQEVTYPFTGMYELIDMNKASYLRMSFVNGKRVSTKYAVNQNRTDPMGRAVNSWLSQLWYCIAHYVVAVPAKVNGEWTGCWVLGGDGGSDPTSEHTYNDDLDAGGGGSIDWGSFLNNINPPSTGPDPLPTVGGGTWTPVYAPPYTPPGDYTEYYDQLQSVFDGLGEVDADADDSDIGYDSGGNSTALDNDAVQDRDLTQPFPTKTDIMGVTNFVRRISPKQNCMELARMQMGKLNYKVGGYDPGGQTFQIYKRSTGIDKTEAEKGVKYMIQALQNNKPVLVGADYGATSPNSDGTTNHFFVVVGMGSDANGNYFQYYDNITSVPGNAGDPRGGTNPANKLYYNAATGALEGDFISTAAMEQRNVHLHYKISQIRKTVQ